jgi:hypothetical protein
MGCTQSEMFGNIGYATSMALCIINSDDDFLLTPHKNKGKQPVVTKLSISRNNFCLQHAPKEKAKILAQTKTTTSLLDTQSTTN